MKQSRGNRRTRRLLRSGQLDTSDMIPLAEDVDLDAFFSDCYALSHPHGLGTMHYTPGPLPADHRPEINPTGRIVASADYLLGRCVKMCVWRYQGRLWIRDHWPRHTDSDLVALCARHAENRDHYRRLLEDSNSVWLTNTEHLSPLS